MAETIVTALVEGGKASAGPPLGPSLGPTGVNVGKVIQEINQKTKDFQGVQVPVKIIIETSTKEFRIEVGSPPVSALLKKEFKVERLHEVDIPIDYVIKVSRIKKESMLANTPQAAVKEVLGTCKSMHVTVDGKDPKEVQKDVDTGKYNDKIEGRTELKLLSAEEIANIKEQVKKIEEEEAAAKAAEEAAKAAEEEAKAAEEEAVPEEEVEEKPEEEKEEVKPEEKKEEEKEEAPKEKGEPAKKEK